MVIQAKFENGVFTPSEPVSLPDGTIVRVVLEDESASLSRKLDILNERFPGTIGVLSDRDAIELQGIIDRDFSTVNPDEWQ